MNNLDSLQAALPELPPRSAGVRARQSTAANVDAASDAQLFTPSGNALPPQAKPAQQSAIQRSEDISAAVEKLSDFAQSLQRALSFSVDDITGQTILTVKDSESDEIVRQIPSEELVQLARKLQELQELQEKIDNSTGNLFEVTV